MRAWREQMEEQRSIEDVTRFSEGKEFFHDVRGAMANLIESGVVGTLQEAYDMACWGTPQVREVMLQRQSGQQQQATIQGKQVAATGASVKPNGAIDVKVDNDDNDDLSDTIRKAYSAGVSGRV